MYAIMRATLFMVLLPSLTLCGVAMRSRGQGNADHKHIPAGQKERGADGATSMKESLDSYHYKDGVHNAQFDHEMILGSHEMVDEFEGLSTEESKERLTTMYGQMDANGDGVMDKSELSAWIANSFTKLSREEAIDRFGDADANDDGEVTIEEHIAEDYGIESEEDYPDKDDEDYADTVKWIEEDKKTFKLADKNGDDKLDKEEYYRFVYPEEHEDLFLEVIKRTVTDKDTNGDGLIQFEEFMDDEDSGLKETQRILFDEHDKNKDGVLSGTEELKPWIIPDTKGMADEEAEHLFEFADDDKDGGLTLTEVLSHWDAFVPSRDLDADEHDEL